MNTTTGKTTKYCCNNISLNTSITSSSNTSTTSPTSSSSSTLDNIILTPPSLLTTNTTTTTTTKTNQNKIKDTLYNKSKVINNDIWKEEPSSKRQKQFHYTNTQTPEIIPLQLIPLQSNKTLQNQVIEIPKTPPQTTTTTTTPLQMTTCKRHSLIELTSLSQKDKPSDDIYLSIQKHQSNRNTNSYNYSNNNIDNYNQNNLNDLNDFNNYFEYQNQNLNLNQNQNNSITLIQQHQHHHQQHHQQQYSRDSIYHYSNSTYSNSNSNHYQNESNFNNDNNDNYRSYYVYNNNTNNLDNNRQILELQDDSVQDPSYSIQGINYDIIYANGNSSNSSPNESPPIHANISSKIEKIDNNEINLNTFTKAIPTSFHTIPSTSSLLNSTPILTTNINSHSYECQSSNNNINNNKGHTTLTELQPLQSVGIYSQLPSIDTLTVNKSKFLNEKQFEKIL
jgi:hypothetical protein